MIGLNRGIHAVENSFFELQSPFFKEMNGCLVKCFL